MFIWSLLEVFRGHLQAHWSILGISRKGENALNKGENALCRLQCSVGVYWRSFTVIYRLIGAFSGFLEKAKMPSKRAKMLFVGSNVHLEFTGGLSWSFMGLLEHFRDFWGGENAIYEGKKALCRLQ